MTTMVVKAKHHGPKKKTSSKKGTAKKGAKKR